MKAVLYFLLTLCLMTISCSDEIKQEATIVVDGDNILIGSEGIYYKIENKTLSVGDTLKIDFGKTETAKDNAVAVLYYNGEEVGTIKEFPFTFEMEMNQDGVHQLDIMIGTVSQSGSVSVDKNKKSTVTIYVEQ